MVVFSFVGLHPSWFRSFRGAFWGGLGLLGFWACLDAGGRQTCSKDEDCSSQGGGRCIAAKCTSSDASEPSSESNSEVLESPQEPIPERKAEVQPEPQPEPRPEVQPEPQPEPRPEVQPEPQPETSCPTGQSCVQRIVGLPPYRDGGAQEAIFRNPHGLILNQADGQTFLYIADTENHLLRRLNLSTTPPIVETIAGIGSSPFDFTNARLSLPQAADAIELFRPTFFDIDQDKGLLFADRGSQRLRRLLFRTKIVETIAGSGSSDPDNPLVTDPLRANLRFPTGVLAIGQTVYLTDTENHVIRRLSLHTQPPTIEIFAGTSGQVGFADGHRTGMARFNRPTALASDGKDNLFIADTGNRSIRKLELATGNVFLIAGNPFINCDDSNIRPSCYKSGILTQTTFYEPRGLAYEPQGTPQTPLTGFLYVADAGNHAIYKLDLQTDTSKIFAGDGTEGFQDGPALQSQFNQPLGLALRIQQNPPSSTLYVAERGNHRIRAISQGQVTTAAGSGDHCGHTDGTLSQGRLDLPTDVRFFNGSLYIADFGSSRIKKADLSLQKLETFAGSKTGSNYGFNLSPVALAFANFANPKGLSFDGRGNLWIADTDNHAIRRFNPTASLDKQVETLAGQGFNNPGYVNGEGSAALFRNPHAVLFDDRPSKNVLHIADTDNHSIRTLRFVNNQIQVETLAGPLPNPQSSDPPPAGFQDGPASQARFEHPHALALDLQLDRLYVADRGSRRIREIDLANGSVATLAGSGQAAATDGPALAASFLSPQGLALQGRHLWIADYGARKIRVIDLSVPPDKRTVSTLLLSFNEGFRDGLAAQAAFRSPQGLAFDSQGHLLIADTHNCLIRRVTNPLTLLPPPP